MWSNASMTLSGNRPGPAALILALAGLAYPFAVYWGLDKVPPGALALMVVALVVARLMVVRRTDGARILALPLLAVLAISAALAVIDPRWASLAYPVVMSLGMAAAFALSLRAPPSLVEILARISHPDPGPAARTYMRRVSMVWLIFLLINAGIAAATLLMGDMELWTLYNGLISYLLMGLLLAGEYLVRPRESGS